MSLLTNNTNLNEALSDIECYKRLYYDEESKAIFIEDSSEEILSFPYVIQSTNNFSIESLSSYRPITESSDFYQISGGIRCEEHMQAPQGDKNWVYGKAIIPKGSYYYREPFGEMRATQVNIIGIVPKIDAMAGSAWSFLPFPQHRSEEQEKRIIEKLDKLFYQVDSLIKEYDKTSEIKKLCKSLEGKEICYQENGKPSANIYWIEHVEYSKDNGHFHLTDDRTKYNDVMSPTQVRCLLDGHGLNGEIDKFLIDRPSIWIFGQSKFVIK